MKIYKRTFPDTLFYLFIIFIGLDGFIMIYIVQHVSVGVRKNRLSG